MGLLDINFEPEIDFGVFFEICDVTIKHDRLFCNEGGLMNAQHMTAKIKEELGNVRVEADFKNRIRPNKEDIINIIYNNITDKNIVRFMEHKNPPQVSFTSGTIEEYSGWGQNSESKWVPKLHITVTLPEAMLKEEHEGWSSFNYRDILTISLIDKRLLGDPEWLDDVERRKKKIKKFW